MMPGERLNGKGHRKREYIRHPHARSWRRITDEDRSQAVSLFHQGKTPTEIGTLLGRAAVQIRRILHAEGIRTPILKWDGPRALALLREGVPISRISREVGQTPRMIRQYAKRHGDTGFLPVPRSGFRSQGYDP